MTKILCVRYSLLFLVIALVGTSIPVPLALAQEFRLPAAGMMVHLSPEFHPAVFKGVTVHPENPFKFDFILERGNDSISNEDLKDESKRLVKYFLSAITTPEKDLWVNLSPYEKQRIIPDSFGQTDMGRDLLAEDYMLKQITASLIYPEDEVGKQFWRRVYTEANKKFGRTNIPLNTFNKVWIVPDHAKVYERGNTAFVIKANLKVMLEEDYLALGKNTMANALPKKPFTEINALGSQIVREIVIPQLEKEVNENKNFSRLRQVYNSLVLAMWFKKRMKDGILGHQYIDKNKVNGIDIDDKDSKLQIYEQYLKAFKKGVYNYIKKETDPFTQEVIPRKYFSGGFGDVALFAAKRIDYVETINDDEAMVTEPLLVKVQLQNANLDSASLSKRPLIKGYRDNRSGYGFLAGKLVKEEAELKEYVVRQMLIKDFTQRQAQSTADALVRMRNGSFTLRKELLGEINSRPDDKVTFNAKKVDIDYLMDRIKKESEDYKNALSGKQRPLFTENQIHALLYEMLIPLSLIKELMSQGLNKTDAIYLARTRGNPKEEWQNSLRPIRDQLKAIGVNESGANALVFGWRNPLETWQNEFQPLWNKLTDLGVTPSRATYIVTHWDRLKRSKMVEDEDAILKVALDELTDDKPDHAMLTRREFIRGLVAFGALPMAASLDLEAKEKTIPMRYIWGHLHASDKLEALINQFLQDLLFRSIVSGGNGLASADIEAIFQEGAQTLVSFKSNIKEFHRVLQKQPDFIVAIEPGQEMVDAAASKNFNKNLKTIEGLLIKNKITREKIDDLFLLAFGPVLYSKYVVKDPLFTKVNIKGLGNTELTMKTLAAQRRAFKIQSELANFIPQTIQKRDEREKKQLAAKEDLDIGLERFENELDYRHIEMRSFDSLKKEKIEMLVKDLLEAWKHYLDLQNQRDEMFLKKSQELSRSHKNIIILLGQLHGKYLNEGLKVDTNYKTEYKIISELDLGERGKNLDQAMSIRKAPGGIDLTSNLMKLDINKDQARAIHPMDLKILENIEINGLYIKDIQIEPIMKMQEFLGIDSAS